MFRFLLCCILLMKVCFVVLAQDELSNGEVVEDISVTDVKVRGVDEELLIKRKVELTEGEREAIQLGNKWEDKYSPPILGENGKIIYHWGESHVSVICSANKLTDIEFEAGEFIKEGGIFIGDSVNWEIFPTSSGQWPNIITHLIIKPMYNDLETDLFISTNERPYRISLKSTGEAHMKSVGFVYPEKTEEHWQSYLSGVNEVNRRIVRESEINIVDEKADESIGVDINNLDFRYEIKVFGSKPVWYPERVFNDGVKIYIQFSSEVTFHSIPVLLVEDSVANELVNYRYKKNTFIVDRLFKKGVLLEGVGGDKNKVTITYMGD